ncbi:hypothetical protein Bbelb_202500 [Branchiostoma belcheri]|nr:hypothetical protein Bbelb_202500 [Branchiostoma belcheri]
MERDSSTDAVKEIPLIVERAQIRRLQAENSLPKEVMTVDFGTLQSPKLDNIYDTVLELDLVTSSRSLIYILSARKTTALECLGILSYFVVVLPLEPCPFDARSLKAAADEIECTEIKTDGKSLSLRCSWECRRARHDVMVWPSGNANNPPHPATNRISIAVLHKAAPLFHEDMQHHASPSFTPRRCRFPPRGAVLQLGESKTSLSARSCPAGEMLLSHGNTWRVVAPFQ